MALHRDILWLGRQWAVTGSGLQAIDQKFGGRYDVGIARLWDDDPAEGLHELNWFKIDDFHRGLAVARQRHPASLRAPAAPLPVEMALPAQAPEPAESKAEESQHRGPVERRKLTLQIFHMKISGSPAKLVKPWRIQFRA